MSSIYSLSLDLKNLLHALVSGRKSFTRFETTLKKYPGLANRLYELCALENKSLQEVIWILLNDATTSCRHSNSFTFINYKKGYAKYCGHYCKCMKEDVSNKKKNQTLDQKAATNKLREETMLKKYGVKGNFYTGPIRDAISNTMQQKYGVSSPQQSAAIRAKTQSTNVSRYGASSVLSSESNRRTDINNTLKADVASRINKAKNTVKTKYNVENVSQIPGVLEKKQQTYLKNYGATHYMQSRLGKSQYTFAILEKFSNRIQNVKQIHLTDFAIECLNDPAKFAAVANGKTLGEIAECLGIAETTAGKKVIEYGLCDIVVYRPNISSGHRQLSAWLNDIGVSHINNCRTVISPKEVDIFIPEYNLCIEYCGVYYHTELRGGKSKQYHRSKFVQLADLGLQLLTIYDTEWINKTEIVKTIILNKLKKIKPITSARKLKLMTECNSAVKDFCNMHHMQGAANGISLALVDDTDQMHAAIIFGKNRFFKNSHWEIYRFCTAGSVPGALSKLLTHFCRLYNATHISTYVDHRYGNGDAYLKIGFSHVRTTVGFHYVDTQLELHNRVKFQKHKLLKMHADLDSSFTEWQLMQQLGYDRIWDCGQTLLTYRQNTHNINNTLGELL